MFHQRKRQNLFERGACNYTRVKYKFQGKVLQNHNLDGQIKTSLTNKY